MSTSKVELTLVRVALALIAVCMGLIGYLLFQPAPEVRIKLPIAVSDRHITNGEGIDLLADYCTDNGVVRHKIELLLLDKNQRAYSLFSVDNYKLKAGCHREVIRVDSVRLNTFAIEDGEYKLRVRSTAEVNVLKTETIIRDSETFTYNTEER